MKHILMKCETYTMIIAALQIKRCFISDDDIVDVMISDESRNSEKIVKNLKDLCEFRNVYYIKTKEKYKGGNFRKKIRKIFYVIENEKKASEYFGIFKWKYDEFYFCNFDITSNQIYWYLLKYNANIKCHRFEEGYSTYLVFNDYKVLSYFMKVVGFIARKKILEKNIADSFFYEPKLVAYKKNVKKRKIPSIKKENKDFVTCLNRIFEYSGQAEEFSKPFIFFEESFCVDKKELINDYEVVMNIVRCVGKENIIVKIHPRNECNRFLKDGLQVGNSNIPWEIILLNGNFDNSLFLTISSGSVINSMTWNNCMMKTILLYKTLPVKPRICDKKYEYYVMSLMKICNNNNFFIPNSIEEFKKIIKEIQ